MPSLPRRATNLLTLCLLLALATIARAQPVFDDLPTLEWRTAQADLVLTATIVSVSVASDEWGASMVTLELSPVEVFKGQVPGSLLATMPNSRFHRSVAEGLTERMEAGHADVWFLTRQGDGSAYTPIDERVFTAFIPLLDPPIAEEERSWLRRPLPPAVTMDLVRHDGKDAVAGAIRRVVREEPPRAAPGTPPPAHGLHVALMFQDRLWPENANPFFLTAPADARLEALARRLVEQPASFFDSLPPTATQRNQGARSSMEAALRHEGAKALAGHFQNEENAGLLVTLLNDPSTSQYRPSGLGEPTRHLFTTRKIAFDALTAWGLDVPDVQLEAPMVDAAIAPSPAAMHAVHGPHMDGLVSVEFLIELGGDQTPELLRLTYLEAKGNAIARDLDALRAGTTHPIAFTVFAFAQGEAIPIFHAAGDIDGFPLQLREFRGHPALVYQPHTKDPIVHACGWWPIEGDFSARQWITRTGTWNSDGTDIEFSGRGPLFWRTNAK